MIRGDLQHRMMGLTNQWLGLIALELAAIVLLLGAMVVR